MKQITITKEEFIERSMKGEVFIDEDGDRYFYDDSKENPFRLNDFALHYCWNSFDGKKLFTLEEPEPIIERRWLWLYDSANGITSHSAYYMSDKCAEACGYPKEGWYKSEMFIDVEIK